MPYQRYFIDLEMHMTGGDYSGAVFSIAMALMKSVKAVSRVFGSHRQLKNAGVADSHHIIQNAAAKNLANYNRLDAPTVQLKGPARDLGVRS